MPVIIDGTNGITQAGEFNSNGSFGFKNRLINGAMVFDQRNAGASVTPASSAYTLDRWQAVINVASKFSVQQSSTTATGFSKSLLATSTSAYSIGASEYCLLQQAIEGFNIADLGFGTANAKTVNLSFQVRSSLTGTFGGVIANSNFSRCYPFTYTISTANTYESKTITIAGDTSGTWDTTNGAGILVNFSLGSGSTVSGTADAWAGSLLTSATGATSVVGVSGATLFLTGVQLEEGSTATSFDYRNYGTELNMCQRYYELTGLGGTAIANTSTQFASMFQYKVSKRATPTASLTVTSNVRYRQFGTADRDASTASVDGAYYSTEGAVVFISGFSGLPTSSVASVNYTTSSNSGNLIALSAEL